MPIGNELYVNNSLELLKGFIFDSYLVRKRKGVLSGYGLRKEDFNNSEKNSDATPKIFSKRIKEFLKLGYLKRLEHKSGKEKYYEITPLGITYFCTNYKKIDPRVIDHVMSHLKSFYEQGKPSEEISYIEKIESSWSKLTTMFSDDDLIQLFTSLFKEITQEETLTKENKPDLEIILKYKTIQGLTIPVITYEIVNDEYRLVMDSTISDIWTDNYYESNKTEFNYNFAKFILKGFAYSILENCSHKLMISNTGRKNTIKSTINKIPVEIHGMALEFSEDLSESKNKTSRSIEETRRDIHQLLKSKKIKTLHEKYGARVRSQFQVLLDVIERESPIKNQDKLRELIFQTSAWRDKKELEQFWSENIKDIRKAIKGVF